MRSREDLREIAVQIVKDNLEAQIRSELKHRSN
jgi:hypothetical protein